MLLACCEAVNLYCVYEYGRNANFRWPLLFPLLHQTMGLNKDSILLNLLIVISVVEWILMWVISLPSTIKDAAQKITQKDGRIFHFYKPLPNSLSLSSASESWSIWAKSTNGDLLGTDSGVFMSTEADIFPKEATRSYKFKQTRRTEKKKDYPPPIPTLPPPMGNLSIQNPCYLSRNYCDGRLILRLEIVKSYEYFESIREDGCLMLNLKRFEIDNDENLEEQEDLQLSAGKDKGMSENYDPSITDDILQNGSVLNFASLMTGSTFIDGINTFGDMHGNTITAV
ncbi:unnamed protein product [Fraxinus pennsylvanica]|uniref:FAF domain-containing protein n=1 Tax=Fraxinus pennsylvanica TaxID=56036 RepID=A0AAD1ZB20_9LAMI|nr:unnamed protein product [Fraxinus pennsylvanica]